MGGDRKRVVVFFGSRLGVVWTDVLGLGAVGAVCVRHLVRAGWEERRRRWGRECGFGEELPAGVWVCRGKLSTTCEVEQIHVSCDGCEDVSRILCESGIGIGEHKTNHCHFPKQHTNPWMVFVQTGALEVSSVTKLLIPVFVFRKSTNTGVGS